MELQSLFKKMAALLFLIVVQQGHAAVSISGGGEELSCSTDQYEVPVYGGWASCYAPGYGTIQDYIPSTYSSIAWLRENVWEDGRLMTYSCTASLSYVGSDIVTSENCAYAPEVSLSVSPVYFRDGEAWIRVMVSAESATGNIDTIAWDLRNSNSFSGRTTTSWGATRESHEVKLPSPLPSTIFAEVTVVDDMGNSVVVGGQLDVTRRSGGR